MIQKTIPGQLFEVGEELSGVLRHFYCIKTSPDETQVQHLSPHYEMMLVFNFGAPVRISFNQEAFDKREIKQVSVMGPLRKLLNYELLPGSDVMAVIFTLNGFFRLFQVPMHKISGEELLDPDQLLNKTCFAELWRMLKDMTSLSERIALLTNYTATFVRQPEQESLPLLDSIPYFHDPAVNPVKAVATDYQLSDRTVQLRFQKHVGYSPKELLRFLRFKQVVNRLIKYEGKSMDWHDLIVEFGYNDQSHFIKDFNHFLGTTPHHFLKSLEDKAFCVSQPGKMYPE